MIDLGTRRNLLKPIAGIAILSAVLVMILLTGASVISQGAVEQRLQQFSSFVSQQAASNGKQGKFTYGAVGTEGWGYDRQVVVENVSLEISEKALLDTSKWSLSTTKMIVASDLTGGLLFLFPEPVNVIRNSQVEAVLSFPTPLGYHFEEITGARPGYAHTLQLPRELVFAPPGAVGDTHAQVRTLVSYDANPLFTIRVFPQDKAFENETRFTNIKISEGEGTKIAIASVSSRQSEVVEQNGQVSGNAALSMVDIFSGEQDTSSKPSTFDLEFTYHGDAPGMNMHVLAPQLVNMTMQISKLSLSTDDYRVKAAGTLATLADDPLPSGTLDVEISDVEKMIAAMPEMARPGMRAVLHKIVPVAPEPPSSAVSFVLRREKNGVFYVGGITFEEMMASLFSNMLSPAAPPPPAETPAQPEQPAVIDHGR